MKVLKEQIIISVYSKEELTEEYKQLCDKALLAAKNAYAPYSHFKVGAAVLLENGEIISGNNQENAAYPSGLCAERVALFYAGAQYPDIPVLVIAISAVHGGEQVGHITPCGACRQVLLETEQRYNKPVKIVLSGKDEVYIIENASSLLPLCFGAADLK